MSSSSFWRFLQLVLLVGIVALWLCSMLLLHSQAERHGISVSRLEEFLLDRPWAPHELWPQHGGPRHGAERHESRLAVAAERLGRAREAEQSRRLASGETYREAVAGAPPVPPLSEPGDETPIILEISSFLDGARCGRTLGSAFERARHPARISVYVLQARDTEDADCLGEFKANHVPRLCGSEALLRKLFGSLPEDPASSQSLCMGRLLQRVHAWVIPPEQGMGPVHQRGLANLLLRYEEEDSMCLSMDSHMGFLRDFDSLLIEEWASVRNEFAVLTVYPTDISSQNQAPETVRSYPVFCGYEKEKSAMESGMPRGRAPSASPRHAGEKPHLTMNWAAGFSFHRCHAERVAPADMYLKWMFSGEEANRAIRLWTNGYDLYIPTLPMVLHEYHNAKQMFWQYKSADATQASQQRLRRLLRMGGEKPHVKFPEPAPPYTLGTQRTMEQFVNWSRQEIGETWGPWLQSQGQPVDKGSFSNDAVCRALQRWPVRDEAELVASVAAVPPARGASRLSAYPRGRLEVWNGSKWGTVCKLPWAEGSHGPDALCKQLGYASGAAFVYGAEQGAWDTDAAMPAVAGHRDCRGSEASVLDCAVAPGVASELTGCGRADDVGIECWDPRVVKSMPPQQHGCCQVSRTSSQCAGFEYAKGCCPLSQKGCEVPMCQRGFWNKKADFFPSTGTCEVNEAAVAAARAEAPPGGPQEAPPIPVH